MDNDELRFSTGLLVTGATLAAAHWLPWWKRLPRLMAYTVGVACILLGQGCWLGFDRRWRRLVVFSGVAGGGVLGAYGLDLWHNTKARRMVEDQWRTADA